MPLKKCQPKGVGTSLQRLGGHTSSTAHANGICINLFSANSNGGRNLFEKKINIPPSKCEASLVKRIPISPERNLNSRRRAVSLNRECHEKRNLMRPPSADPLPKLSADCYRNVASSKSEGAPSVNRFKQHGPKTGMGSQYPQGNVPRKGCTINLQPGHYKVNIEWRSASKPFLITFIPSKDKGEGIGTPPTEPEPLLYVDSSPSPSTVSSISLPQRIVHKFIRSPNSSGSSNGHIVHHTAGIKKLPDNSRQNHRKGKHRWASLSCVHMGSLDDSLSEHSGCDSFAGYEGVEHLKRGSVITAPYDNDNNSQSSRIVDCNIRNMASSQLNFLSNESSRSCSDSLYRSSVLNSELNKEYFPGSSNLPLHTVSCEAIINSHVDNSVYEHVQDRRTWNEDESFLKQVVDEYFNDSVNDCDASVQLSKDVENLNKNLHQIKKGIIKSTSDCYLSQRSKPITANIIPLQSSSKISSSCIITKTCSLLETVDEISHDCKKDTEEINSKLNFDDNLAGDADETTSWHSDNSSGYEADTEPSDKEVYGMFFWREWMSAPDVSSKNRRPTTNECSVDFSKCEDIKYNINQVNSSEPSFLHCGPRKSSSTGDTQKLSQTFVGVEKFRAHKLRRFLDDLCNESKVSSVRKIKRIEENEDFNISKDFDEAVGIPNNEDITVSDNPVNPLQHGGDCPYINLEFASKKYLGKNDLEVFPVGYCVQRKSDTSLHDRLSIDLTEKALSEGLVITQSRNLKVDSHNLDPPHLLGDISPPKFRYNSGTRFMNKSNLAFEKIESAAAKSRKCDHSCLRERRDSIREINSHKNGCSEDDYYPVRIFSAKNRSMKNISKKRLSKHLNGDIWQSEEILSCCMSPDKPSSLQHFQDGSENMACSPSFEQSPQSFRSDFNLTQPFVSIVGRVLERGTKQEKSAAKETTQRSELHVPPVSLFESGKKEQSMPLSGKPASPLQQVPNPHRQYKVSKYIMGNVQPGKENNSSLTEDSDSNVEVEKSTKKKSSSRVKSRKSFNTFLGSFGAAGALAKNISNSTDKKKANIFLSSNVSENCKDSPYNITANKIKCDTYVDKTQCSSTAIAPSHGQLAKELWTPANERANYSPVRRKDIKEFKNTCDNSDCVATNVLNIVSKGDQYSICENEKHIDQPIYENIAFHKQRYVGKFSYINSLIPNSDTEEKSVINPTESDILSRHSAINSNTQPTPSVTSHVDSFIPCASDYGVQNRKSNVTASDQTNFSAPLDQSDQFDKLESMELNEIYEDFLSAKDSPRSSVAMPFKYEDDDVSDGTEEVSDDENSVAKGSSSLCHSASAGSVVSDASSFYYTAGAPSLHDAVEDVTEYFSVIEMIDLKETEISKSDSLPEKCLEVEGGRSKESELIFKKVESDQEEKEISSEIYSNKSDSSVQSESHDYENANVLVTDDKIFITLKTSDDDNTKNLDDSNCNSAALKRDTQKLAKIGNESTHEKFSKLENEIHSENMFNSKLQSKINPNYRSYSKLRSRANIKNKPTTNNSSSEYTNKSETNNTCENAEADKPFICLEDDINSNKDNSLNIEEELESKISVDSFSESYANDEGVVRAFPCVVISENDTKIDLESSKESFEETITISHEDTEDLLASYYSQLDRNKDGSGSESSFRVGTKLEEEILTTEPDISSNYAPTTFSESTNEIFNENLSSSGNSESRHTMEEYRASPFSSSEGISEHSGSEPSNDFGSSLSCDGTCDQPHRKNIFRVPLSGPTFPHRRHTFQFAPTSDQNRAAFYAQRRSNPDLPPVLGSWNLSPTSPMDAKKPPRSPSHRGRDSSSVPREGRSSIQMRRRCRSVSSGSSGEASKEGAISCQHRPSSLISISTGHATSSQESLHDFPLRFSPAAGDRAPNIRWLAERKKHEGNECYKNKDYRDALKLYTEAIELCPECAPYYSNRSACYMMLGKYAQAISDAREAVRLDSTFVKGYLRIVKCHIALGDPNAALAVLRQATELDPSNKSIREEEVNAQSLIKCIEDADKAAFRKDFRMAIFHLDRALSLATGCRSHKITKAEYLIFLHRYADAQEIVNEILQFDSGNADAIYVRGMCLYYQNNHEAAFTHFQHVLRLAPDHKKAKDVYKKAKLLRQKKDEGNQAFNRGNLQDALRIYSEALAIDPNNVSTNSKLYCNRATVRAKLCNFEEAVEDVTAAINLEEGYVKAYLRRAKCYQELEKHEDAVRDYEKACKLDRNQENKRLLQEAKALLKRSKWKDYYKILGVTKTATEDEIKKSYKKMALQHHPDRHASASDKMKHEHELKFKEIGEAYTVLTDNKKKAMYDRGQDINDPDCGMFSHDEVDPNQIFQAFFNQSGSNAFGFGNGFPGTSYTGSNSNNFPGGFHFQFS